MNMLSAGAFLRWLPALRGHPRLGFGKSTPARVLGGAVPADDQSAECEWGLGILGPVGGGRNPVARRRGGVAPSRNDFLEIGSALPLRLTNVLREPLRLRSEQADEFLALELPLWREVAEVELPAEISLPAIEEAQPSFRLQLEGSLQHLRAVLRCHYGERPGVSAALRAGKTFCVS